MIVFLILHSFTFSPIILIKNLLIIPTGSKIRTFSKIGVTIDANRR